MTKSNTLLFLTIFLTYWANVRAFTKTLNSNYQRTKMDPILLRNALSDRQMQFWEDVEDGIQPIRSFYAKDSSNPVELPRITEFVRSCKGDVAPPQGHTAFHQPCEEYIPGLTAKPFWQVTDEGCDWAMKLEENAHIIIDEFNDVSKRKAEIFAGDSAWQNKVMGIGWSAIRLKRLGAWNSENCALFPKTYELLMSLNIPLAVRGVCFARQAPLSGVAPHSDGRNFILTAHLGLKAPKEAWIKVGDEQKSWETGKVIILDTSFEHSTGNPSNEDRFVLIIDFWHPELSVGERKCLEFVYDLRNKFESGLIPVRAPRASQSKKDQGLRSLWGALVGSGNSK